MTLSEKRGERTIQRIRSLDRVHQENATLKARTRVYAIVPGGIERMNTQRALKRLKRLARFEAQCRNR